MKIEGPGASRPSAVRRSKGGGSAPGGFSDAMDSLAADAASGGRSTQAASSVGSIDTLLALQGVTEDDESMRRRRGVRRAEDILDRLEDLKTRLLMGGIPVSTLRDLVQGVQASRDTVSDPRLSSVLDEVDLRARVELAKLGIDPFAK